MNDALRITTPSARPPVDLHRWLAASAVMLWLAFVGWAIWQHVQASGQPLIYDAITYWLKAKNVWASVAQGNWVNPLGIDPTTRPPGTVLMSYPFGFEESPKGFLFRSVFLGITLVALAVFLAAGALQRIAWLPWDVACVALFLCALPMFYHFEWSSASGSPGYWGLTDCFLAGVAAFACSAAMLGAARASWVWTAVAALLASLCFLTKPAGALIVVMVMCTWFVIVLARLWAARSRGEFRPPGLRTLGTGAFVFGTLCGPVLLAGFRSSYFSAENVAFGNRVLKVMTDSWASGTPSMLPSMIHTSFGYASVIALVAAVLAGLGRLRSRKGALAGEDRALAVGGLLAAIVGVGVGFWFWWIKTGGSQVRYFYPFALMAVMSILPLTFIALDAASQRARYVVRALLLLLPLNSAILLAQSDPPAVWQRMSGVNLAANPIGPDVVLGRAVLDAVRQEGRGTTLYATTSEDTGPIASLWGFEELANPGLPNIRVKVPFDWQRPTTFRLAEIGAANFILSKFVRDLRKRERRLSLASVHSYEAEQHLFEAFFSGIGAKEGVQVFGETDRLRLLRVVDHGRLEAALEVLKRSRQWRPLFLVANPQTWWSDNEISARLAGRRPDASRVGFGGLFHIEALYLEREGADVRIDLWWKREKEPPPGEWFFFAHLVDAGGAILANVGVRLAGFGGYAAERPHRFDSLTVPLSPGGAPKAIAFGVYRAEAGRAVTLVADSGNRDWDNHRVLVPLP
ncbi:MAG: hypothetical protein USCGTAYLOR_00491 [Chromatiales bacterium USCg_Taylor]|nr:MAG: hypothetical protein USCGTAYLOR_00491 [Chromatiales bacterium USCg_Taylor]